MMIADNTSVAMSIRQSALIVLKNMVFDECTKGGVMHQEDYHLLKGCILEAMNRIWSDKQLTNVLREVIHVLAEKDYPQNWP